MEYEDYQYLRFERPGKGILLIKINRPEVLNATNARLHNELTCVWSTVEADDLTNVVVITGEGDKAFSAGGDMDLIEGMIGNSEEILRVQKEARDLVYNILAFEKPVISAINGVAVGAGLAVALLADISVMNEDGRLSDGHTKLGVGAGDHAAIIWPLLCGMAEHRITPLYDEDGNVWVFRKRCGRRVGCSKEKDSSDIPFRSSLSESPRLRSSEWC